jgi:hypothetical protein
MLVHTKTVLLLHDNPYEYTTLEDVSHDYDGQWALADRAANAQAKQGEQAAQTTASNEGATANSIQGNLIPFYSQEMNTQHGFTPQQANEMLTYSEGGAGGATSGLEGEGNLEAARTGNTSSYSGVLDDLARNKQKTSANASEGIGAEDVASAKQLNQAGASGEAGLYGADTTAMLNAMGIQTGDINAEVNADKTGWFQNLMQGLQTVSGMAGAASGVNSSFMNGK